MRYVGRTLGIGLNSGRPFAFYLLCSRSFPNRRVVVRGNGVYIVNQTETDNPYVSYPVVRLAKDYAVVTNGLHTDFIAQALEWEKPRKALVHVLDALDYERDDYSTPRIAGIIKRGERRGWFGFVGREGLWVRELELEEGRAFLTATYNMEGFEEVEMGFSNPEELLKKVLELPFGHKVLAIGIVEKGERWELSFTPPL